MDVGGCEPHCGCCMCPAEQQVHENGFYNQKHHLKYLTDVCIKLTQQRVEYHIHMCVYIIA